MREVQEVLREKSKAVEQIRREVEALRLVTTLLADEGDDGWDVGSQSEMIGEMVNPEVPSLCPDTEDLPSEVPTGGVASRAKAISHQLKSIAEPFLVTFVNAFRA